MKIFKNFKTKRNEVEYWKTQAESYERAYKREMFNNMASRNAILKLATSGKISGEAQSLYYDLVRNEMKIVYEKLI